MGNPVIFPVNVPFQNPPRNDYNFQDLDYYTQQELLDVCDQDFISFTELRPQDREVLWDKRHYLCKYDLESNKTENVFQYMTTRF